MWLQGLLTAASKRGGAYEYNFATVPLLAEGLKFLISSAILRDQLRRKAPVQVTRSFKASLLFLVPSIVYWVHNNVQFVTLRYLDPATYQVLGNLKIVTTGVLFWALLRRPLTVLQWLALLLLMLGAATSQARALAVDRALHSVVPAAGLTLLQLAGQLRRQGSHVVLCSARGAPNGQAVQLRPRAALTPGLVKGYSLAGLSALLSALAAVYTEWALKRNADSLYWQNMQLYSYGFLCNAAGLTLNHLRGGGMQPSALPSSPTLLAAACDPRVQAAQVAGGLPPCCTATIGPPTWWCSTWPAAACWCPGS